MGLTYLPFTAETVRASSNVASAGRALVWTERVAAAVMLTAVSPVLIPAMGAVRLLSGRSPLVAHRRVGRDGDPIWVLKVRTMWGGDQSPAVPLWIERLRDPAVPAAKSGIDPRVTSRFAAFCRRHSIDELPQLLHVISGEMQLVGPRPMTDVEIEEHYGDAAREVLSVRPGLTGLWQVMGRNRLTYAQRRRLDLFYVRRASWGLYARILLRTAGEVLSGRNAS